jgi:hypothetical protein
MKIKSLLSVLTLTISIGFAQVPNYVPTNGLVAWWPFNGNANDVSGNGYNGAVNGATLTADRFGNTNSAYNFQSSVSNFINANIGFQTKLTIAGWYKASTPDKNYPCLFYYGDYPDNGSPTQIKHYTTGFYGNNPSYIPNYIGKSYASSSLPGSLVADNNVTTNNNWHQFVVSFDYQSAMNLYVDGVLTSTVSYIGNIDFTSGQFFIGRDPGDNLGLAPTQGRFHGDLDDFGVWSRILSQQEITNLFNGNVCYQNITVTDTLVINTTITGFNPVTYQNTAKIYPNPTNDHITIDNGNIANLVGYQIKISNSLGQQVFLSAITQQQFYLDITTWGGNGLYFVNTINAQGVTIDTKKIIIQ